MATKLRSRKPGDSSRRRSKRKHRRASGLFRVFETITAMIPAVVFLIHLALRSSAVQPKAEAAKGIAVAVEEEAAKTSVSIAVVPEPSSLALIGVGSALLFYRRRPHRQQVAAESNSVIG